MGSNLFESHAPLSEKEFQELEKYLEKYAMANEEGFRIETISVLDGYLTAVISSPVSHNVNDWLTPLFNFGKAKQKTVEKVINLVFRHYNSIVYSLNIAPENSPFKPMFDIFENGKEDIFITDSWCMGYIRFVELSDILVNGGEPHLEKIMKGAMSLFLYNEENKGDDLKLPPFNVAEKMAEEVLLAVYELHYLGRKAYLEALEEELNIEETATRH